MARYTWMRLHGLLLISGAFAAFRRQAVLDVGGFDSACLVEDYELIHRLMRHSARQGLNWNTAVVGQARAYAEVPGDMPAFLRQRGRWFGGFLQTQYWYRDMVGQPQYGEVGMRMLPVKAVDTLQPFFGLSSLLVLLLSLAHGRWNVLLPAAGLLSIKALADLAFHGWLAHLYRRWTGETNRVSIVGALLAALLEPWSFQILRQAGAVWGWAQFLIGRQRWGNVIRSNTLSQAIR